MTGHAIYPAKTARRFAGTPRCSLVRVIYSGGQFFDSERCVGQMIRKAHENNHTVIHLSLEQVDEVRGDEAVLRIAQAQSQASGLGDAAQMVINFSPFPTV